MTSAKQVRREYEWKGGDVLITLSGADLGRGVAVLHITETHAGSRSGREVTFAEGGPHRINLPPCTYAIDVPHRADGTIPDIRMHIEAAPRTEKQKPSEPDSRELLARLAEVERKVIGNSEYILTSDERTQARITSIEARLQALEVSR